MAIHIIPSIKSGKPPRKIVETYRVRGKAKPVQKVLCSVLFWSDADVFSMKRRLEAVARLKKQVADKSYSRDWRAKLSARLEKPQSNLEKFRKNAQERANGRRYRQTLGRRVATTKPLHTVDRVEILVAELIRCSQAWVKLSKDLELPKVDRFFLKTIIREGKPLRDLLEQAQSLLGDETDGNEPSQGL